MEAQEFKKQQQKSPPTDQNLVGFGRLKFLNKSYVFYVSMFLCLHV